MATQNSNELAEAIDIETGRKELMPRSETVGIKAMPLVRNPYTGKANQAIPATLRCLGRQVVRVIGLRKGTQANPWVLLTLQLADGGKSWCNLRNRADVFDPLFDALPSLTLKRLLAAVA